MWWYAWKTLVRNYLVLLLNKIRNIRRAVRVYANTKNIPPYIRVKFSAFPGRGTVCTRLHDSRDRDECLFVFGREHYHFVTWHNKRRRSFAEIRNERYPVPLRETMEAAGEDNRLPANGLEFYLSRTVL